MRPAPSPVPPDPRAWCALAGATTGAAPAAGAEADAAAGAARTLAAAESAASRLLAWDTPLLPLGPVLQDLARPVPGVAP